MPIRICSTADLESEEIERLERELRAANKQLDLARAEIHGIRTGQNLVGAQLAHDIRLGATREEQHRVNAARGYQDQQRLLRIVASHVLDARGSAQEPETVEAFEALAEEIAAAGIVLRPALLAVQVERAEANARVSAADAAAAVANAPVPHSAAEPAAH